MRVNFCTKREKVIKKEFVRRTRLGTAFHFLKKPFGVLKFFTLLFISENTFREEGLFKVESSLEKKGE